MQGGGVRLDLDREVGRGEADRRGIHATGGGDEEISLLKDLPKYSYLYLLYGMYFLCQNIPSIYYTYGMYLFIYESPVTNFVVQ